MGVSTEVYVGYTVTLKENLKSEDFEFFEKFTDSHDEYDNYNRKSKSKVRLIEDGMNGLYARLIYIDSLLDEEDFYQPKMFVFDDETNNFEEKYKELNEAYRLMYGEELDRTKVKYSIWFHVS